jgi:hypothetical protein
MLALALLVACKRYDYQPYLRQELGFVQLGVQLASEEREVRRVLGQRGLRVVARLESESFIAIGAATRDRSQSAVRVVSRRGVVVADDATMDDLFAPGSVSLLEHFGGTLGELLLLAHARVPRGQDAGCVTLHRVLPDGSVVQCPLDVTQLGARACVSNLAQGRGGRLRATVAWPGLHALTTPQLDVELAFTQARPGQEPPRIPVAHLALGPWLDTEGTRLSTLRLGRAEFSQRHAAGVARAAIARLSDKEVATQVDAYRNAVGEVLPGTTEAQVVSETAAHIQRGWLDPSGEPSAETPAEAAPELSPGESVIGDPTQVEPGPAPAEPADDEGADTVIEPADRTPATRAPP